jgi:lipopolysaccharide/colanic/teichoic acid biosynthesis glycosyltransferase
MSSSVIRLAYIAIRRRAEARRSGGITLPDLDPGPGAEEAVARALHGVAPDAPRVAPQVARPTAVGETYTTLQAPPQGAALIEVDTVTGAAAIPSSVTLTQRVAVAHNIDTGATVPLQLDLFDTAASTSRSDVGIRALNVAMAAVLLLVLSPLLLLIMAAIKLSSPGPVFYKQVRVGLDRRRHRSATALDRRQCEDRTLQDRRKWNLCGRTFTMYKFRTMRLDAESATGPVWASRDDPRVTPIGGFLRACRLDELPQLYNVLKGDMNIVGPRPERPTIVVDLVNAITEYPIRQRTLPGITGLAQISQAPDGTVDDVRVKVRYDLEYMRRRSVLEDLRIMAKTPAVMFLKRTGR